MKNLVIATLVVLGTLSAAAEKQTCTLEVEAAAGMEVLDVKRVDVEIATGKYTANRLIESQFGIKAEFSLRKVCSASGPCNGGEAVGIKLTANGTTAVVEGRQLNIITENLRARASCY